MLCFTFSSASDVVGDGKVSHPLTSSRDRAVAKETTGATGAGGTPDDGSDDVFILCKQLVDDTEYVRMCMASNCTVTSSGFSVAGVDAWWWHT